MTVVAAPRGIVNLRRTGMTDHSASQRRSECILRRSFAACTPSFVCCQPRNVQRCTAATCRTSSTAACEMHGWSRVAGCTGCRPLVQPSACCGLKDDHDGSVFITASTRTLTLHMSGEAGLHLHGASHGQQFKRGE